MRRVLLGLGIAEAAVLMVILLTILLMSLLVGGARADAPVRTIQARLTPLGYCQITASNPPATAVPLSSCAGGIPAAAIYASITIETTPIRYRDDGTNPTAALGMPLVQGQNILYTGNKLSALVFVASIAGTATINVAFYGV